MSPAEQFALGVALGLRDMLACVLVGCLVAALATFVQFLRSRPRKPTSGYRCASVDRWCHGVPKDPCRHCDGRWPDYREPERWPE